MAPSEAKASPVRVVSTAGAPEAIGPYVQGIVAGGFLFASGQVPIDPKTGAIVGSTVVEQAHQVLKNLQAVVAASGTTWDRVVKVTIFLTDLNAFASLNGVYAEYFSSHRPARACVEVSRLPKDALVEMDLVAAV